MKNNHTKHSDGKKENEMVATPSVKAGEESPAVLINLKRDFNSVTFEKKEMLTLFLLREHLRFKKDFESADVLGKVLDKYFSVSYEGEKVLVDVRKSKYPGRKKR